MVASIVSDSPNGPTDDLLLQRWRAGDRRAGDVLLDRYRGALESYFVRKAAACDAEDLVQETLLRSTRAIRGFESRSSFRTYLMKIAKHTLHDHLRRRYRRVRTEPFDDGNEGEGAFAEYCMLELERHAPLLAALAELGLAELELLELRYWDGVTARELGRRWDTPEGTIRRWLRRTAGPRQRSDPALTPLSTSARAWGCSLIARTRVARARAGLVCGWIGHRRARR